MGSTESFGDVVNNIDKYWGAASGLHRFVQASSWSLKQRFKVAGILGACPTWDAVAEYYKEDFQWIHDRYNRTNSLAEQIGEHAKKLNPPLYQELTTDKTRTEAVGVFEKENVPSFHDKRISWMAFPENYAASRLLILLLGDEKDTSTPPKNAPKDYGVRAVWMFDVLDRSIKESKSRPHFLAVLAQNVRKEGVGLNFIMGHVLEYDKLKEEGNETMYRELVDAFNSDETRELREEIQAEISKNPPIGFAPGWKMMWQKFST